MITEWHRVGDILCVRTEEDVALGAFPSGTRAAKFDGCIGNICLTQQGWSIWWSGSRYTPLTSTDDPELAVAMANLLYDVQ